MAADRRYALIRRSMFKWSAMPDYYIMANPDRDKALLEFVQRVLGYEVVEVEDNSDEE